MTKAIVLGALLLVAPLRVSAQPPQRPRPDEAPAAPQPPGVAPAEIQRLFDAYIVMQAQQQLQLSDDQFVRFLPRVKALQDVRRRFQNDRMRMLAELRRMTVPGGPRVEDAALVDQLKALADLEARSADQIRQAVAGVDAVLDARQQARFRLFEDQMDRRKIELLMRARQSRRANPPQ